MNSGRVRQLKKGKNIAGPVLYWMSRDQRSKDNWSLIYAQKLAIELKQPLLVTFCLVPDFLGASIRHYDFMLQGLKEVKTNLEYLNIPFILLTGFPEIKIPELISKYNISQVITDFDPLKIKQNWKLKVHNEVDIPFYEVDSHNIIPCWLVSKKQEFGAYTLRPKIEKKLMEFLVDYPAMIKHPFTCEELNLPDDFDNINHLLKVSSYPGVVNWIKPGESWANLTFCAFKEEKLANYAKFKNDPTKDVLSNLSIYLHFGQISAQRIAVNVERLMMDEEAKKSFLEELIVRRELSDNYCYYNQNYDSFAGFPQWAQLTITDHKNDPRDYIYSLEEFESAKTHDPLWNAAQQEMVITGKMHGYMRMYWAKKILEWTTGVQEAQQICIYLNDKYELDGRDPNGYTGIAWSIGGVHDRAWPSKAIFGKIRYMNYNGCKRKFKVNDYISKISDLETS